MIIERLEREALDKIRATDPETAKRFLYILKTLAANPIYKDSSLKELTEAIEDLVLYSGVMYQEKKEDPESLGNILIRI